MAMISHHADQAFEAVTKDGTPLIIRPVTPEDAPLFLNFHKTLSDNSLYYRFFRHVKELTPELLDRLTRIDDRRDIALVSLSPGNNNDIMTGVVRIIGHCVGKTGEFFILIADAWQGRGIGTHLISAALNVARNRGYERIYGVALPENESIKHLARKIGFQVKFNFENKVYELTLDLTA